jgi:hypothetical protein
MSIPDDVLSLMNSASAALDNIPADNGNGFGGPQAPDGQYNVVVHGLEVTKTSFGKKDSKIPAVELTFDLEYMFDTKDPSFNPANPSLRRKHGISFVPNLTLVKEDNMRKLAEGFIGQIKQWVSILLEIPADTITSTSISSWIAQLTKTLKESSRIVICEKSSYTKDKTTYHKTICLKLISSAPKA